jgi:hypothetical protein
MATLADLYAANPRRQGEGQLAYQQRIGAMSWNQPGDTDTDLTPLVKNLWQGTFGQLTNADPQGPGEPNVNYAVRSSIANALGGALAAAPQNPVARALSSVGQGAHAATIAAPHAIGQALAAAMDTPEAYAARQAANGGTYGRAPGVPVMPLDAFRQGAAPAAATPTPQADPITSVVNRIIGNEGTGQNPRSSAVGVGQFLDGTVRSLYKSHYGKDLSPEQIAAVKQDPATMRALTQTYVQDNASSLSKAGLPVTPGTLYGAHYLGAAGVKSVLTADPNTPLSNLAILRPALNSNPELTHMTASGFIATMNQRMAGQGPTPTQAFAGNVNNAVDALGGFRTGFDPTYMQAALGELNKAQSAALQPASTSIDISGAPTVPDAQQVTRSPEEQAARDKASAAIEALKPHEISDVEATRIRRNGWLSGIGQGLSRFQDGDSLGSLLAHMGGGALQGAAEGDKELQQRMDHHDELMARYNTAVANNSTADAQSLHQDMIHNTDVMNQNAMQKFSVANDRFFKFNNASVTPDGEAFMTSSLGPDGKVTMTRTPIPAAVASAFALRRASVMTNAFGVSNEAARQTSGAQNALVLGTAATAAAQTPTAQNGPQTAAGMTMGLATLATDVVAGGSASEIVGAEPYKTLADGVQKDLIARGILPGTPAYADAANQAMATKLVAMAGSDANFRKRLLESGGPAAATAMARRQSEGSTTVTRNSKGLTTTREQY